MKVTGYLNKSSSDKLVERTSDWNGFNKEWGKFEVVNTEDLKSSAVKKYDNGWGGGCRTEKSVMK